MSLQYSKFQREDGSGNVTLFHDKQMYVATSDHPNWDAIIDGLTNDDPAVVDLFDVARVVERKFKALSDRVSVSDGRVYFDNNEVDTVLARQILRFLDEGQDFAPLVKFYERLAENPNQESVDQLYRWLESHNFTITSDGRILGYKGVESDGKGGFQSVHTGRAIVNGEPVNGKVPNNLGYVVEMPRDEVTFDPYETCSTGLHIGTWEYAQDWGRNGAVLKVLVDPKDVVSVPSDANGQKLRACRYVVLDVLEQEIKTAVEETENVLDDDDFDHEYCELGDCVTCDDCDCVDESTPYCSTCDGPCILF